ncbi:hypothetical protein B0T18DRAFT_214380 [Schizothecium vesticola]|uniref:Uncharacterized protein n=1 Tax=Schizothecium vesticola TaxID=314040 RepID=A0AA40EJY6_9PEZI|nr:hypothetical protein B0T18DRAFT_214380 [Schizothecium vesticola]
MRCRGYLLTRHHHRGEKKRSRPLVLFVLVPLLLWLSAPQPQRTIYHLINTRRRRAGRISCALVDLICRGPPCWADGHIWLETKRPTPGPAYATPLAVPSCPSFPSRTLRNSRAPTLPVGLALEYLRAVGAIPGHPWIRPAISAKLQAAPWQHKGGKFLQTRREPDGAIGKGRDFRIPVTKGRDGWRAGKVTTQPNEAVDKMERLQPGQAGRRGRLQLNHGRIECLPDGKPRL